MDKHGLCSRQLQDQDMNLTNNVDVSYILNLFILFYFIALLCNICKKKSKLLNNTELLFTE